MLSFFCSIYHRDFFYYKFSTFTCFDHMSIILLLYPGSTKDKSSFSCFPSSLSYVYDYKYKMSVMLISKINILKSKMQTVIFCTSFKQMNQIFKYKLRLPSLSSFPQVLHTILTKLFYSRYNHSNDF